MRSGGDGQIMLTARSRVWATGEEMETGEEEQCAGRSAVV